MRTVAILVAGGAGWLFLPRALALAPDDPLAGTVAVVPLVAALLAVVDSHLPRWAGRSGFPPGSGLVALAAWSVLVAARGRLGFPWTDPALAATAAVLLGLHLRSLLPALLRALGRARPLHPPWTFFAIPLVVYVAILPWATGQRPPDGDEPYYLLIAHSLAYDGDTDLADNYLREDSRSFVGRALKPQLGDPSGPEGERFSRHSALLPLLLALPYRLTGRTGALLTMAAISAALAWCALRLALRYAPARPRAALEVWALLALMPPLLLFSHQVWVEVPAALLVVVALDALHRLRQETPDPSAGTAAKDRPTWLRLAICLLLLPLLKPRFLALSAALAGLALIRLRRDRRGLAIGATVGAGTAVLLLYNLAVFGRPFRVLDWSSIAPATATPALLAASFLGLFFDAAFGLFAAAPLWLLLAPGAARLLDKRFGSLTVDLVAVTGPYLLLVASRQEWYGGWSPPFRYGVAVLPLLALALLPLLGARRTPGGRAALSVLGTASAALTVLWLTLPGWTYNFAHGSSYLLDRASAATGLDLVRLFPSFVRPRLASWLWPPLATLAVFGLWHWRGGGLPAALRRGAARGGAAAAALAVACATAIALAAGLPSGRIELEDAWVRHSGGTIYPAPWTPDRTRYPGAWMIPPGSEIAAPVVAGGSDLRIALRARVEGAGEYRADGPLSLQLYRGDQLLDTARVPDDGDWHTLDLGPFPWHGGADLRLAVAAGRRSALVDRADLEWSR